MEHRVFVPSSEEGENINSEGTTILENEPRYIEELTTAVKLLMFSFNTYTFVNGWFVHSKAYPSASGQSVDPLSGTDSWDDISRLDIDLDDEEFMRLPAEAFGALQASEGNTQWSWPEWFNVIPGAGPTDTIEPVVRVLVYAHSSALLKISNFFSLSIKTAVAVNL